MQDLIQNKPYLQIYRHKKPPPLYAVKNVLENNQKRECVARVNPKDPHKTNVWLSSAKAPYREALAISQNANLAPGRLILILGLGSPETIYLIQKKLAPLQICIVVDADFTLGQIMIRQSNRIREFLRRPGCHIFCGEETQEIFTQYLSSIPMESMTGQTILRIPSAVRADATFYSAAQYLFKKAISTKLSDIMTRIKFQPLWLLHTLKNSHFLVKNAQLHCLHHFKNCLSGKTGVLIGSGPSLDKQIPLLARIKKKAFLLTVSSTLPILAKHNIVPDGVISLDGQHYGLLPFLGFSEKETILFADIVSHPSIFLQNPNLRTIFFCSKRSHLNSAGEERQEKTPGVNFVEETLRNQLGSIVSGGSVSTSGFHLLEYLGCKDIFLIGQDNQYTLRQIHARGSHQYERWMTSLSRKQSMRTIIESIVQNRKTIRPNDEDEDAIDDTVAYAVDDNEEAQKAKKAFHKKKKKLPAYPRDYILEIYFEWFSQRFRAASDLHIFNFLAPHSSTDQNFHLGRRYPHCINIDSTNLQEKILSQLNAPFALQKTKLAQSRPIRLHSSHPSLKEFFRQCSSFLNQHHSHKKSSLHKKPPSLNSKKPIQMSDLLKKYSFLQNLFLGQSIQIRKKNPQTDEATMEKEFKKAIAPFLQSLEKFMSGAEKS